MRLKIRIAWTDGSDRALMQLAGWSAIAHAAALVVFSLLPRLAQPPAPPRAVMAEIVPASALLPQARTGPPPAGPTPSQRAEAARKAMKPKAPPEEKPPAPKPKQKPAKSESLPKPGTSAAKPAPPAAAEPEEPAASEEGPEDPVAEPADGPEEPPASDASGGVTFGGSGGPGGIPSIGSSAFPYDYYRSSLVGILRSNWRRPVAADASSESQTCSVQFTILKSGIIQSPMLARRSGNEALDQSALRAVYDSNPLPPLPFQYGHASVSAEVVFELTPD